MRSLPPPRRSRRRRISRLLHHLYKFLTLECLFRRQRTIVVKKRRTPFHFTSRKYKVKVPKVNRRWWSHEKTNIAVEARLLGELSKELDGMEYPKGHVHRGRRAMSVMQRVFKLGKRARRYQAVV